MSPIARSTSSPVVSGGGRGSPSDVIAADLLREAFGLEATVIDDPVSDRPLIVPIGTRHVYGAVGGPKALLTA